MTADDPRPAGEAERVILCGPPKGCTCPAVAWYCICEASKREPRTAALRAATTEEAGR